MTYKFDPGNVKRVVAEADFGEGWYDYDVVEAESYDQLLKLYRQFTVARPISEYHEDMGACLWWDFPIIEPPYCGTPNDCDWPEYHTHFTRLTNDMCPSPENGQTPWTNPVDKPRERIPMSCLRLHPMGEEILRTLLPV